MDTLRLLREKMAGVAPGLSAAYLHAGRADLQVLGNAQTAPHPAPLHAGALYDLASLTKVIGTTTLFLQALDAGKVALDQPIATLVPEFTGTTTFRQALTHTSGLEGYIPHRDDLAAPALRQALLTQLSVTPEVDQVVVYRDVNLLLVGWALERLDLAPIQTLITHRVLRPLDLPQATFTPHPERCVPTSYSPEFGLRQGRVHDPKSAVLGCHSGAAGLFASLEDLMRFSEFAFGTRQSPAWPASFARLAEDYTVNGLGRSLGWDLRTDAAGRTWLYHTGFTGTFWLLAPALRQSVIVLTNRVHPRPNLAFLDRRDEFVAAFLKAQH
ncbi:serine hydrolase domain-containing protein [Lacticaseibacillus kribbianus]|uniref:serine hydrolase domain-containing protein n=1 Tax=Lacticaseibacillus kribbianus TaxID=2926292 RepID=UPI001CD2150C|nr:serine hydrolase domain-containing protein [Lacticaseibacillus kribbianus]